ncbi:MAG: hypothetical protein Q8Q33_03165 [Chlamydiota bacterium]|nr:hypothetical protein [Chlamydiota bacterium]
MEDKKDQDQTQSKEESKGEQTQPEEKKHFSTCSAHQKPAQWNCKKCHKDLCTECQPIGYANNVYCAKCIDKIEEEIIPIVSGRKRNRKRPFGVLLFSMWHLILAVSFMFLVANISVSTADNHMLFSNFSEGLKVGIGFLFGLLATWNIVLAFGLMMMKRWSARLRFITTVFWMVSLIIGLIAGIVLIILFVQGWNLKILWMLGAAISCAAVFFIEILIFEYFDNDKVKNALTGK